MEGYILRDGKEQLTLSTAAADKLLQSGQGDAALLYLALCRFGRGVTPEELERALPISRLRKKEFMEELARSMGNEFVL